MCRHKWVHKSSDGYYYFHNRNWCTYVYMDNYFCEKCLEEKGVKKEWRNDHYEPRPEWAMTITKQVAGSE